MNPSRVRLLRIQNLPEVLNTGMIVMIVTGSYSYDTGAGARAAKPGEIFLVVTAMESTLALVLLYPHNSNNEAFFT